ncbi:MAG TPA: UDP-N-acetylglucosamine 1-carboxyvinyltransferase [Hungateiclostridium thermocellum]|uniref:UDP-N-acetylglucosamine 1-carboxyvinyltransferase n=2 Tax=Acetivibrio thermocellus TaxID=1515 RepID=A3DIN6_ACET2|nr:UDP-N-acetylglucosamine 1-carboxyvinyltransferase [Acetivibrio thermocellus]CDG37078.1 UDP-N-acetylglucosamine 1-carboxyvinyltransferase 1 [Acetivibrio thermocellus BC1]ABN53815.1 UDP-N-acetylglucosamine 1-carboxyvinyltransferase [Acetivibrio thermocellus ATCC 27405]ADU73297.1 UDP-N-acetylglucosamine 1-carboxyvinyltransferase [Acetivibrio thermocellus DSM 1313]ALX07215.1 UDP-N-acetylglucosamine 1-carboxyvinyltransferase [Acetivibrio thermocellus AD2]ANV74951.1 UDP-N-acetylglucosamine 1-carb
MPKLIVTETKPLHGKVRISGAKNSVLPIIAASILGDSESVIEEVPDLTDVKIMCELLESFGVDVNFLSDKSKLFINTRDILNTTAPYELVNKMRASILVMGPLLARTGIAKISLPGGCAIGTRPVDLHLKGFAAMGAEIEQGHGYIEARVNGRLRGNKIYLDFPSVGATENIMMAAVLAEGQTIIENAAIEPEIVDLATYLTAMGADIKGAGTDTIKINGVNSLKGTNHAVIPDRIEAGTFMVAAAVTGGDVIIENIVPDHVKPITAKLREAGVEVSEELSSIHVRAGDTIKPIDIKTHPYPGFPTDMQAQMTSLMTKAEGTSMVIETIFENRFMHLAELKRMGANVKIEGRSAIIEGRCKLTGAKVRATDLRAGAALVLAGLVAEGVTEITEIEHIERGYVKIHEKLNALGANIQRVEDEQ